MKSFALLSLLTACVVVTGCNPIKAKQSGEAAVKQFHEQLNKGDFKGIYAATHADFKTASTEKDFIALLDAVHRKLGLVQSSEPDGWQVNATGHVEVVLVYKTKFAEGDGVETFNYRIEGEKSVLVGYNIASNALITK
jgi:hypothetical protein